MSNSNLDDVESDSDDSAVAFLSVDFAGVDFDVSQDSVVLDPDVALALEWEGRIAFHDFSFLQQQEHGESLARVHTLAQFLSRGQYADCLRGETAKNRLLGATSSHQSVYSFLRQQVLGADSVIACIELECLGIAALNLFLQANYTGPAILDDEESQLHDIHPHACFVHLAKAQEGSTDPSQQQEQDITKPRRNTLYQNAVLAELAVDGEWPCQVCHVPYYLLLARSILLTLADPTRQHWGIECNDEKVNDEFVKNAKRLVGSKLWSARAAVAHERLLPTRNPSTTLWCEVEYMFGQCIASKPSQAVVMLEWGLAQHYFDRPGKGKLGFTQAQELSGLTVQVTGAVGKRTKFQQKATAQMLVRAASSAKTSGDKNNNEKVVGNQLIEHTDDGILLEKIQFENDENVEPLTILDQTILLALCLDVKNSNPTDGLVAEEMGAFLARVLDHHDDWMVYSTALLERSWLEFERPHARERAILQMQALADQHTNRLTITQSTLASVQEESARVQDRLKHLHQIVYPPRWSVIQDLADRYAQLGIVTSAAELYTEIEFWSDAVDCYRRAGKVSYAERIVRERLQVEETPRMYEALGDLTKDPKHYEKAIQVSNGRYSSAYIALGNYYFDKGDLEAAAENLGKALKIRPLVPSAWFRLGTISMNLSRWDTALGAFSEVVQQEPEEADAWANIAAIHMHNKKPAEAYPALVESLKYARTNWRVWVSKLYTCLDLEKYDEAIQACNVLLDLRAQKDGVPPLEEKCVQAIVGGTLRSLDENRGNEIALDSSRRTCSRVHELLDRISASSDTEPWVFEALAVLHEQTGHDAKVLENLMKEYRALQNVQGWEKDNHLIQKMYQLVSHIVRIYCLEATREDLTKARFIVRGTVKKIETARPDDATKLEEAVRLNSVLEEIEAKLQEIQQ